MLTGNQSGIHALSLKLLFCFSLEMLCGPDGELPEKLRNLEPRLIEHISNEIMDRDPNVRWDDIGTIYYLTLLTSVNNLF